MNSEAKRKMLPPVLSVDEKVVCILDRLFVPVAGKIPQPYRQRVTLASGRFAMIDDGLSFQLVPWRPALEQQLGRQVSGVIMPGGTVDWNFGRKRGLGL